MLIVSNGLDNPRFASLRVTIAVPMLYLVARHKEPEESILQLPVRMRLFVMLLGFLAVFVNIILVLIALTMTSVTNVTILQLLIVPEVSLLAIVTKQEKPSLLRLLGPFLSICGGLFVVRIERFDWEEGGAGDLLCLLQTSCFAVYMLLSKRMRGQLGPITTILWMFTAGGAGICLVAVFGFGGRLALESLPAIAWIAVAYAGAIGTALGYSILNWVLQHAPSTIVASYIPLQPVLASFLAIMFLGETLDWHLFVGGALILAGLACVTVQQNRERRQAELQAQMKTDVPLAEVEAAEAHAE